MTSAASSSDLPENMADSFRTDTGDDDLFLVIEYSDALRRFCDDSTVVGTESCLSVEAGGRSLESASSTASPLREISGAGPNMETLRSLSRLGILTPTDLMCVSNTTKESSKSPLNPKRPFEVSKYQI